jgi:hypothetical protein
MRRVIVECSLYEWMSPKVFSGAAVTGDCNEVIFCQANASRYFVRLTWSGCSELTSG